jgi:hypothetical protein
MHGEFLAQELQVVRLWGSDIEPDDMLGLLPQAIDRVELLGAELLELTAGESRQACPVRLRRHRA